MMNGFNCASGYRRIGELDNAVEYFFAMNGDFGRSANSDSHLASIKADNRDFDRAIDDNLFPKFSAEYEHDFPLP
jgi:hypothetical protein